MASQGKSFLCAAVETARDHEVIVEADTTGLHFAVLTNPEAAFEWWDTMNQIAMTGLPTNSTPTQISLSSWALNMG